ncbi:uncharacterized protein ASCRUDRAFT_9292 [Ascoidea rubescens DSM 1968]|uniref:Uncharacterized protein n=1 Tax=Ascoidea rubescens DSM 1968 TaxID=1344418 RepID=A0A1D2VDT2_9ASCO|nr:hypothetical protein ASCRUDRAFT_9292 [Ascoidea rubescens DSM 1968]ODV59627.1 hypothetical protein ASCRUDRAFT_9292 [Ascoidea rubescens DSM 1968]
MGININGFLNRNRSPLLTTFSVFVIGATIFGIFSPIKNIEQSNSEDSKSKKLKRVDGEDSEENEEKPIDDIDQKNRIELFRLLGKYKIFPDINTDLKELRRIVKNLKG